MAESALAKARGKKNVTKSVLAKDLRQTIAN